MDLDRITHPLRLARGSHQPGSGKGCAMNAISYINGDEQITDFPATSARPLASFVQLCNDLLAGPDGYLSPEDSLTVLDLGWLTVGTAEVADTVIHAWVTKLLISPPWGVVRYAEGAAAEAISEIAELHRPPRPRRDLANRRLEQRCPRRASDQRRAARGRRAVCRPGRIPVDRTRRDRRLGHARCRDRQRPACPQTGEHGYRNRPYRGRHSRRDPLMASASRVK